MSSSVGLDVLIFFFLLLFEKKKKLNYSMPHDDEIHGTRNWTVVFHAGCRPWPFSSFPLKLHHERISFLCIVGFFSSHSSYCIILHHLNFIMSILTVCRLSGNKKNKQKNKKTPSFRKRKTDVQRDLEKLQQQSTWSYKVRCTWNFRLYLAKNYTEITDNNNNNNKIARITFCQ